MSMVPSRYNIEVPLKNGRRLVYNSASQASSVWEAREVEAFERLKSGASVAEVPESVVADLTRGGFIVKADLDELEALRKAYNAYRYNPSSMVLTIAPTMACNFGCDYCFQGQDKPTATMSQEIQDAVVDVVRRNAPKIKALAIAWYGGEPLLRKQVIENLSDRLIAVCRERGLRYNGMMVTNGYLLNADTARSLRARAVNWIQVTLDGTPEYHDTRRHLLSKKGTFERIITNLKAAVEATPEIMYAIRVNIDDRNHSDIKTLIDHMAAEGLGHKKNLKMYFAPIEAMTEGCHIVEDVTMNKSAYGQLEAELHRHGYNAGLTALPYPPRFHGVCGAVKPGGWVILPNGDLHKCWDTVSWYDKRVGNILKLDELRESELLKRWMTWTPFDNQTCKNCKILPNCAGACAYKFVHAEDTRGEAAILPCPSWKYNIKERLLLTAMGKGKITRDDFDREEARTIPSELCADTVIEGGKELPASMKQAYIDQKGIKRVRLTVLPPEAAPESGA